MFKYFEYYVFNGHSQFLLAKGLQEVLKHFEDPVTRDKITTKNLVESN